MSILSGLTAFETHRPQCCCSFFDRRFVAFDRVRVQVVRLCVQRGAEKRRPHSWNLVVVAQYGPILVLDVLQVDLPSVLDP